VIVLQFKLEKEKLAGNVILGCLVLLVITAALNYLLQVKVINIEYVDRNLYTVITTKGAINLLPDDILRIESSVHKTALFRKANELNRIYTNKGFLVISTFDNYSVTGRKLINEIGPLSTPVWEREDTDPVRITSYRYAIGTPPQLIPLMKFLAEFQRIILIIGGLTLFLLVCPLNITTSNDIGGSDESSSETH